MARDTLKPTRCAASRIYSDKRVGGSGGENGRRSRPSPGNEPRMNTRLRYAPFAVLLLAGLVLLSAGCSSEDTPQRPPAGRTLLVYFAADNNLAGNVQANLDGLAAGVAAAPDADARVVAYLDTPGENPRLMEITADGPREFYRWPSPHDSASPEVLREVIGRVLRDCPADRYGLVLWSHGMAWVPSSAEAYFVLPYNRSVQAWPATKYFGEDTGAAPAGYLETADLAAAIPDGVFDYMLFDACFMASVEVEYALRAKADWIIAAPTEVITDGFPYAAITGELLRATPDLQAVCGEFYRYYAEHPKANYRSASVSLVRTSELDALASATAELYGAALAADPAVFSAMDISRVQHLDRYRRHFLFDLGSIAGELERTGKVSAAAVPLWREQLARTVVYEAHTAAFFELPIDACCGLSGYVPVAAYSDLNDYYKTLEWYKATIINKR